MGTVNLLPCQYLSQLNHYSIQASQFVLTPEECKKAALHFLVYYIKLLDHPPLRTRLNLLVNLIQ